MTKPIFGLIVVLALTGCSSKQQPTTPTASPSPPTTATPTEELTMDTSGTNQQFPQAPGKLEDSQIQGKQAIVETDKGRIRFKFLADEAPLAVSNFVFLAQQKFYDGLTFHRVEPDFVVQGGDPAGNGTGGPGYTFADEPVTRSYTRGIVAMANSGPNTNGSQFFIMLADTPLPPQYTIFGEVTEGMEVVDKLAIGDHMKSVVIDDQP